MRRVLLAAALALLLLAALGVQSWRLSNAHHTISTQQAAIADQVKKLSQKNGQLIALNILTQTNSQAQTQLYAAAEQNGRLLRDRVNKRGLTVKYAERPLLGINEKAEKKVQETLMLWLENT